MAAVTPHTVDCSLGCAEHSTTHCHCRYRASPSLQQWIGPNMTQVPRLCLSRERRLVQAPGGMAAVAEAEQHEPSVGHVLAAAATGNGIVMFLLTCLPSQHSSAPCVACSTKEESTSALLMACQQNQQTNACCCT